MFSRAISRFEVIYRSKKSRKHKTTIKSKLVLGILRCQSSKLCKRAFWKRQKGVGVNQESQRAFNFDDNLLALLDVFLLSFILDLMNWHPDNRLIKLFLIFTPCWQLFAKLLISTLSMNMAPISVVVTLLALLVYTMAAPNGVSNESLTPRNEILASIGPKVILLKNETENGRKFTGKEQTSLNFFYTSTKSN